MRKTKLENQMSIWKVILICLASFLILIVSQALSSIWYSINFFGVEIFLSSVTYISITYILLKLLTEKWLKQSLEVFRIGKFHLKISWIILAILLPITVISCFILFVGGRFESNHFSTASNISIVLFAIFSSGLSAGIVEEMVFRGIMMKTIEMKSNKIIAIILPSFLFGLVHLLNGKLTLSSAILLVLGGTVVGIMFSLTTYYANSIWASATLHAIWNIIIIGGICSLGINKDIYSISSYLLNDKGLIMTGGQFGIEVSLIAILGYLLVIIYLIANHKVTGNKINKED